MTLAVASCDAVLTLPVGYATAMLGKDVGQVGTGTMFASVTLSALLSAPFLVASLGCKRSMILCMVLGVVAVSMFALAAQQVPSSTEQWLIYVCGSIMDGQVQGVLWTAQGVFFASTSERMAQRHPPARPLSIASERLQQSRTLRRAQSDCLPQLHSDSRTEPFLPVAGGDPKRRAPLAAEAVKPAAVPGLGGNSAHDLSPPGGGRAPEAPISKSHSERVRPWPPGDPSPSSRSAHLCQHRRSPSRRSTTSSVERPAPLIATVGAPASFIRSISFGAPEVLPSICDLAPLPSVTDGKVLQEVTATLAGRFAAIYLLVDLAVKLLASALQGAVLGWTQLWEPAMSFAHMFYFLSGLSLIAALVMVLFVEPVAAHPPRLQEPCLAKCQAAVQLWSHPELWCLAFTNLCFGFSAGYMNGVVNARFVTQSIFHEKSIGTLMATTSCIAAVCSLLFAQMVRCRGGTLLTMILGAASFAGIALAVLFCRPREANMFWGPWLVVLYVMQGIGRSVYESTNRMLFAQTFQGAKSSGAFANCTMQSGAAFLLAFWLQGLGLGTDVVAWIMLVLAALIIPGYLCAQCFCQQD